MAFSSAEPTAENLPLITTAIAEIENLPPESDPKNSIILAVSYVPGFMICQFKKSADCQNFLFSRLNPGVFTSIHASWVLDEQNRHKGLCQLKWKQQKKRQPYMKRSTRKKFENEKERARHGHYLALKRYLLKNDNVYNLPRVWGNLKKWGTYFDHSDLKKKDVWDSLKNQFCNVIDSFMKHGEGLGMTLETYIEFTLRLYEKVDVLSVFHEDANIRFPLPIDGKVDGKVDVPRANIGFRLPFEGERFTFRSGRCVKFDANVLAAAFINNPQYGTFPKLEFIHHRSHKGSHKGSEEYEEYEDVCCLSELKFKFDVNGNMRNHHDSFECNGHRDIDGRHLVATLSYADRLHMEFAHMG